MKDKLYRIKVTHYAPKDMHTATHEYVVAKSDREVFEYLANGVADWNEMLENPEDYGYDNLENAQYEYDEIFKNKCDDRELYDLYYGATQYSWEEVLVKDIELIELMITNGLAEKIEGEVK